MKISARTACRPALVSTISALMRLSSAITTPAPSAWKRMSTLWLRQQIVGRDLVGRGVIGLRKNLAEHQMRRVQPAEPVDARQQLGRDALHQPTHLAMHIGMQPAEIRHPRGGAHAAEKAIALDQQRPPPGAGGGDRSRDAGRPAAEHGDFILAVERHLTRRFFNHVGRQVRIPGYEQAIMPPVEDFGYRGSGLAE